MSELNHHVTSSYGSEDHTEATDVAALTPPQEAIRHLMYHGMHNGSSPFSGFCALFCCFPCQAAMLGPTATIRMVVEGDVIMPSTATKKEICLTGWPHCTQMNGQIN